MFTVSGFIIVFIVEANLLCVSHGEENTDYNNGWRPISNERVLGNLRRNFIKTPEIVHFSASWRPIVHSTENVGHEQITNVKPQDINIELMDEGNYYDGTEMDGNQNLQDVRDQWLNLGNSQEFLTSSETSKIYKPTSTQTRKAKKILDKGLDNNIPHKNENQNDAIREVRLIKTNITNDESNTYEVTEASDASEVINLLENNLNKDQRYFEPTLRSTTEANLSKKLFSILGNYNIRTNDDLPNYAASRHKYNTMSQKQSYAYPPSRYNSQNHLPIDPLLAVFLSNYGHYLPGLYGFPGNYYNIYGYLASNNIHNNKPFGAYKIYSDTDSSH
ncbi:uncharacterized protein [Epargyreus clarus]|uniref:uncharacterized protein n=1 Tax=Epargyreus clarus TaxID=520877 RepID=UPI003C2EB29F